MVQEAVTVRKRQRLRRIFRISVRWKRFTYDPAVGMDEASLRALLRVKKKGVENITALRGDKAENNVWGEFDQRYLSMQLI